MATSFSYGGTDLSAFGLSVTDYTIPEMANIGFETHAAAQGDSEFTSVNKTTRTIALECAVSAASKSLLRGRLDTIRGLLNPVLGDKILIISDNDDRRYIGRTKSITPPAWKGQWGIGFTVTIECLANTQAIAEVNASTAIATNPDTLTISSVEGNESRIPVEIYVRNETGADLTSAAITIANDTTSESIVWTGTLEDDRWLRFGTLDANGRFTSTISKSTSTGSDPEAESYSDVESGYTSGDWPRLRGGVDNDITVTGISTGTLEWTYRGRFI